MSDQLVDVGYAEGWKPKPGDRVAGQIIDIATTDGGYGPYAVLTVKTEDGREVAVHAFHTVLRRELARRRPKVGDDLDVQYLGKKSDGGGYGRGYDVYKVLGGGETGGYDWSRDLPPDERDGGSSSASVPIDPEPVPVPTEPSSQEKAAEKFGEDLPF